jgi:hypothetical protein
MLNFLASLVDIDNLRSGISSLAERNETTEVDTKIQAVSEISQDLCISSAIIATIYTA